MQLLELLELFQTYIRDEADVWKTWVTDYTNNSDWTTGQTLDGFKHFPFDNIITFAQRQQTRLETALNDRLQVGVIQA